MSVEQQDGERTTAAFVSHVQQKAAERSRQTQDPYFSVRIMSGISVEWNLPRLRWSLTEEGEREAAASSRTTPRT